MLLVFFQVIHWIYFQSQVHFIVRYKPARLTDDLPCCTPTCVCKVGARPSLGERDRLLSQDGSRLRSSELQRDTSGDSRWRRSLDRPLS